MAVVEPPAPSGGNTSLLSAALGYIQRGWAVFPLHGPGRSTYCDCGDAACPSPAKHPRTRNGLRDASKDPTQVRAWWGKWPQANIGVACGASRLVVLDVDPRHGGELALAEIVKRYGGAAHGALTPVMEALTSTLTSETGGGGEHYVYHAAERASVRNSTDLDGLRGLDVRADGGYFVAAPSLHVSGARYQWREGASDPAEMPAWLLPVLTRRASQPMGQPVRMFQPPRDLAATSDYWLGRALNLAHEGNRNDRGFWLACQLRDSGLPQDAAERTLEQYAAQVPGAGYTSREALGSLRSAYKSVPRDSARSLVVRASITSPLTRASAMDPAAMAAYPRPAPAYVEPQGSMASDEAQPARRFTFLSDTDCEDMPPPAWLVDGLLVQGQRSMIFGEPASYKSFLALDLALCITTGRPWHGHATHQGRVVYIAGEGKGGLGKRITAWKLYHGVTGSVPISILGEAAQLLRAGDVTSLVEAIQTLPDPPVAIIFDTLARAIVGGDENQAQDMGRAVASIDYLHDVTGAHVMVVHHKARGAKNARGSTALPGGMDTMIDLTREPNSNTVVMHCEKQKESAEFTDLQLRFEVTLQSDNLLETSGVLVPIGAPKRARRPAFPLAMVEALNILREAGGPLRHADWLDVFIKRTNQTDRSFANHIRHLQDEGLASGAGNFWTITTAGEMYTPEGR